MSRSLLLLGNVRYMLAKLWLLFFYFQLFAFKLYRNSKEKSIKSGSGFFKLVSDCIYLNSSLLVWLRGRKLNQLAD